MKFDVLPDVSIEPFSVIILVGDSIASKSVHRSFPKLLPNNVTLVDLVKLDILDFDIILDIDFLHVCFASIHCRTRVVKFQFPNKPILKLKGENSISRG